MEERRFLRWRNSQREKTSRSAMRPSSGWLPVVCCCPRIRPCLATMARGASTPPPSCTATTTAAPGRRPPPGSSCRSAAPHGTARRADGRRPRSHGDAQPARHAAPLRVHRRRGALVRAEKHRPGVARILPGTHPHPFDGRSAHDLEQQLRPRLPLALRQAQPADRRRVERPRADLAACGDIETDPQCAFSNPGCRFTRDGKAILNYWTCEYLPNWAMQDVIDLRVAVIDTAWFYGESVGAAAPQDIEWRQLPRSRRASPARCARWRRREDRLCDLVPGRATGPRGRRGPGTWLCGFTR